MRVTHVVGARPNFMKAAPVIAALKRYPVVRQRLVHTGQHYDENMSEIFFRQLDIPAPDVNLEVGSGTHSAQTAEIMLRMEEEVRAHPPNWLIVYGDVNSTLAAALVAAKRHVPLAHVEAGLRSGDRRMPEEINRLLTDQLADLLFTPSADADENLLREGIAPEKIHRVGNVMIDTMLRLLPRAVPPAALEVPARYALVTLHRPSNVDDVALLGRLLDTLGAISERLPVLFPIHPRTRRRMAQAGLLPAPSERFQLLEPLGYLQFLALQRDATVVITDSGGVQEETTLLGVPCLTVRPHTERPITVTTGTNRLVGQDPARLLAEVDRLLAGERPHGAIPPLWDGRSGERIARVLVTW